jgi:hypothetical protein
MTGTLVRSNITLAGSIPAFLFSFIVEKKGLA